MSQPELLYRNLFAAALLGRGDGTIYAKGTACVPDASAKTFDLTTITFIDDLTEADDILNGYELVITSSGRRYTITDYVAATDVATVAQTPNAEDTGAYTVRRTMFTDDFAVASPLSKAANGRLYDKWVDGAANNNAVLHACAPNLVDDGGFELNSLTDYWSTRGVAGTGTVAINSTSPLLGTYDVKLNQGDQTSVGLEQAGKGPLRKGYTYGIVIKTKGDGGAVTDMRVSLEYVDAAGTLVPLTFTEINGADDTATANIWKPAIAATAAWDEITFVPGDDLDTGAWKLVIDQYDATDVFIDEVYIWEMGPTALAALPTPDTLVIGAHNHAGGYAATSFLGGYRCNPDRSSVAAGDSDLTLIDLDADVTVAGNSPVYEKFTAPTVIYPVYVLNLAAVSGKTWQAGEVWLGRRWTWEKYPNEPLTGKRRDIEVNSSKARGGPKQSSKLYQQVILASSVEVLTSTESDRWVDFVEESGHGASFWLHIPANASMGVLAQTLFQSCKQVPTLEGDPPIYYRASFSFEGAF
jgi:hypothetical protein